MNALAKKIIACGISAMLLVSCTQDMMTNQAGNVNKANVGGLTGAVAGAWIGSNVGKGKGNIAAIAAGTLLGAFVGHSIGASLDQADLAHANRTAQHTFENNKSGVSSTWKNPDSGHYGTITPVKTSYNQGRYCRQYTHTIYVGGQKEVARGEACRRDDGSWEIMK